MRPPRRFSLCFGIALFIFSSSARAEPKPLAALFQNSKVGKTKGKKAPHISIPDEYRVYFKARTLLEQPGELGAIEGVEKELLLTRLKAQNKNLDKELDEVFYALEIKRGAKFAKKKSWKQSFESFQRGLNGMGPFKWIYYWDSEDTKALSQVCKRSKKLKDDACLSLAKRVADAFPKGAAETKILRELPLADTSSGNSEGNGDRLSQTYTEKLEKDEDAF